MKPKCPTCGTPRPDGWAEDVKRRRNKNIKAALAKSKKKLGRPRIVDYHEIWDLRDKGLSLQKIADALHVSRGAVQNALRSPHD